jgi:hypothetical protein
MRTGLQKKRRLLAEALKGGVDERSFAGSSQLTV